MATKVTPRPDYTYDPKLPDLYQTAGAISGFMVMCFNNAYKRRPYVMYNPLLQIPLYVGVGFGVGTLLKIARTNYMEKKVLVAETYIQEHPEEFVEQPSPLYKDVLKKWVPKR